MVPVIARTNVHVEVFDAQSGAKLSEQWHHNLAVDGGLNLLRDYLYGDTPTRITHGAVGTGTTAVSATDTTLEAEVERVQLAARVKGNQSLTIQVVIPSPLANGSTLTEAGLFNDDPGGTMYARVQMSPVIKTALISVLLTWTLSFASS